MAGGRRNRAGASGFVHDLRVEASGKNASRCHLRLPARLRSVFAMNPRVRRIVLVGLCLWLLVGLVLCGPAHHVLHDVSAGDAHASDSGVYCDGCALSALECVGPVFTFDVARCSIEVGELPPPAIPSSTPALHRSPRGPPRAA